MIHPEQQAVLRPYLLPGERLLWVGGPKHGLLLRSADLYLVPFSLFFVGFASIWNLSVGRFSDAPLFFRLVGAAILLVGLYALVGRFLVDAFVRTRLLYAVTDRRVAILRRGPFPVFRALDLCHLPMLELDQRAGGRGSITFDAPAQPGFWSRSPQPEWTPSLSKHPRFLAIENAAGVYDLISRQIERLRHERLAALPPDQAAFIG